MWMLCSAVLSCAVNFSFLASAAVVMLRLLQCACAQGRWHVAVDTKKWDSNKKQYSYSTVGWG